VLHIIRFLACQNELRQPLPNNRRELKAVPTDRKVLFTVDFLTLWRLARYFSMKKNELPALFEERNQEEKCIKQQLKSFLHSFSDHL
jgi:hypothetical protein